MDNAPLLKLRQPPSGTSALAGRPSCRNGYSQPVVRLPSARRRPRRTSRRTRWSCSCRSGGWLGEVSQPHECTRAGSRATATTRTSRWPSIYQKASGSTSSCRPSACSRVPSTRAGRRRKPGDWFGGRRPGRGRQTRTPFRAGNRAPTRGCCSTTATSPHTASGPRWLCGAATVPSPTRVPSRQPPVVAVVVAPGRRCPVPSGPNRRSAREGPLEATAAEAVADGRRASDERESRGEPHRVSVVSSTQPVRGRLPCRGFRPRDAGLGAKHRRRGAGRAGRRSPAGSGPRPVLGPPAARWARVTDARQWPVLPHHGNWSVCPLAATESVTRAGSAPEPRTSPPAHCRCSYGSRAAAVRPASAREGGHLLDELVQFGIGSGRAVVVDGGEAAFRGRARGSVVRTGAGRPLLV